jgi:hypothetical protein
MKTKLLFIGVFFWGLTIQAQLSKLTFGVGIGGNHLFKDVYDYSLTTDSKHELKINELGRNAIVVSPVIIFRLGKITTDTKSKKTNLYDFNNDNNGEIDKTKEAKPINRLSLLLSTDLINADATKVAFNKSIDGGIGIGYSFASNLMIGVFYEIKSYRQLRNYIVDAYQNTSIPNGSETFNALDENNNNLFYNKKIEGVSVKLIFNINTLN